MWGIHFKAYYFIDAVRGHFDSRRLCKEITALARQWNVGAILIEETGYGREAIPRLQRLFNVVAITQPSQSKVARAHQFVDIFRRGDVYVRRSSAEADNLIEEFVSLGHGSSSDLADSTTQLLAWHGQHPQPLVVTPKPPSVGVLVTARQARSVPRVVPGAGVVLPARANAFGLGEPATRDERLVASMLRWSGGRI